MGLFLQIVVFLIVAAALGFAVGWLVRGARLQEEQRGRRATGRRASAAPRASATGCGPSSPLPERRRRAERARREAERAAATGEPRAQGARDPARARARGGAARAAPAAGRDRAAEARVAELQTRAADARRPPPLAASAAPRSPAGASAGPRRGAAGALAGPEGEPDDLKRISGIGPGIEKTLHELGIFHFRQIAAFTPENVAWVNRRLRFKGRIEREDWIGQARTLAAGGETEFSQRQQARHS